MRLLSAEGSSIPVERIWNVYGDNFTAKRHTKAVYACMNMHLLPSDHVPADMTREDGVFNALFEDAES